MAKAQKIVWVISGSEEVSPDRSGGADFMLGAMLKHCLAMPIHNSDKDSASKPPSHSNSSFQLNSINGRIAVTAY